MQYDLRTLAERISKGNYIIVENFRSYRNIVYKVEVDVEEFKLPAVLKLYSSEQTAASEVELLNRLADCSVQIPRYRALKSNTIILEYLPGETVNMLVQKLDTGEWIEKLAEWFSNLHLLKKPEGCLLKVDVNLKNFIYSNGKIYGLDFEEEKYGDYMDDISDLCFFFITNSPSLVKEKSVITKRFLKAYQQYSGHSLEGFGKYLLKSRQRARLRREMYRKIKYISDPVK